MGYKDSWWYKLITCSALMKRFDALTQFLKDSVDKTKPHSSHELVNLLWGIGSFFAYWADHFINHRSLTGQDYMFLLAMSGITAISSISSKKTDSMEVTSERITDPSNQ